MSLLHPLALGTIQAISPVLFTNNSTQQIRLNTIRLFNRSSANITYTISLIARGLSVMLAQDATLQPGYTSELIADGNEITIDPGTVIVGYCPSGDNRLDFIIDSNEDLISR